MFLLIVYYLDKKLWSKFYFGNSKYKYKNKKEK